MLCSDSVRMAIHFFVNFDVFKSLYLSTTILINNELGDFVNLGVLFLTMWINMIPFTRANAQWVFHGRASHSTLHCRVNSLSDHLIIYRLLPSTSRFENSPSQGKGPGNEVAVFPHG